MVAAPSGSVIVTVPANCPRVGPAGTPSWTSAMFSARKPSVSFAPSLSADSAPPSTGSSLPSPSRAGSRTAASAPRRTSVTGTRFIGCVPMKVATKTLAGVS